MQESGLTEIIPFIFISVIWDQFPAFPHPESLGLPGGNGCQTCSQASPSVCPGGLEWLKTVASLFINMAGCSISQANLLKTSHHAARLSRSVCQPPLSVGILQTIILEWVARPSFRESSQPREQTQVSRIAGRFFFFFFFFNWWLITLQYCNGLCQTVLMPSDALCHFFSVIFLKHV